MSVQTSTPYPIGVVREYFPGERRVAVTPNDIRRLANKAVFRIEADAGAAAGFSNQDYAEVGALVTAREEVFSGSDVIVGVRPPQLDGAIRPGTAVISLGGRDAAMAEAARQHQIVHLGLERLPRITRAQSMDVLSSQAAIAGYAAVIEGARMLDILLPMLTTAAGVIRPAKMIALGAGVAGLQAIATARRLGAMTFGFDVREAAREQVESLGASFVFPEIEMSAAEGSGGYAAAQSADQQERLRRALTPHLSGMNMIVTSAQIPGHKAPLLIDEEALSALSAGTVVIDLAAESGGNVALTRPDEVVTIGGVRIFGPTNMASAAATDASRLFGGNVRALLEHLLADGHLDLGRDDPIISALVGDQTIASREPLPA